MVWLFAGMSASKVRREGHIRHWSWIRANESLSSHQNSHLRTRSHPSSVVGMGRVHCEILLKLQKLGYGRKARKVLSSNVAIGARRLAHTPLYFKCFWHLFRCIFYLALLLLFLSDVWH